MISTRIGTAAEITEHQRDVVSAFVEEKCRERSHVVIHLSGAHAYGFPSPDSDFDLKAIHVAPTSELLGFHPGDASSDQLVTVSGVELDYTSNELGPVMMGILRGNGNYLERVLGTTTVMASPWLEELRPLVARSLNRRFAGHYKGFADQQRRSLEQKPTVKRLLYVLRTLVTGIHALRTGELIANLPALAPEYGLDGVADLVSRKREGERTGLEKRDIALWSERVDGLFDRLERERRDSPLPPEPPNEPELEAWLLSVRRALF